MRSSGRPWVVAVIVCLHGLLLWLWPQQRPGAPAPALREMVITLINPRPPRAEAPPPRLQPKLALAPRRLRAVREPERAPEPAAITLAPAPEPEPIAELAPAPVQRPTYDIGKIDKEIRSQSLNPAVRETALSRPRMERLIGGAYKPRGPAKVEELVMSDGSRVSKVGGMCAMKRPSAMVGGYDAFKNGNETLWRECPK